MIRLREVLREAWRNTNAGVSRPLLAGTLFTITIGAIACAHSLSIVEINRDAAQWRQSGASTQIISSSQHIDGVRCEALNQIPGITAGALRTTANTSTDTSTNTGITLAALPSAKLQTLEATPGLSELIGVQPLANTNQLGMWISADLANTLKIQEKQTTSVETTNKTQIPLSGVYPYAEDGRLPILAYNLISPVPATGKFDTCWIEIWPESKQLDLLLTYPVIPDNTSKPETPETKQFNASQGLFFAGQDRLNKLPFWALNAAAITIGLTLGYTMIRIRRLELAGTLHSGIDKLSLTIQIITEYILWVIPPAILITASLLWITNTGNPDQPWPAFVPGIKILITATIAAQTSTAIAIVTLNEKHLFRYFKNR